MDNVNKVYEIKCPSCHGNITANDTDDLIKCAYCGTVFSLSNLLNDSDEVKTTRIKAQTYKDIELAKIEADREENIRATEKENNEKSVKYKKSFFGKITLFFGIICILVFFSHFKSHFLCALIAGIQSAFFISSWLMGARIIPEKKPSLHTLFALIGFLLIIVFFYTFSIIDNPRNKERVKWNDTALNDVLPKPETNMFYDYNEYSFGYSVYAFNVSQKDYKNYISTLIENGYEHDSDESAGYYTAYNSNGAKVRVSYDSSDEEMYIDYDKPDEVGNIIWPKSNLVSYIPKPNSDIGKIHSESEKRFKVDVANISHDQYDEYVNQCIEKGFTIDYTRNENKFSGNNEEGIELTVSYSGYKTLTIEIEDKSEEAVTKLAEDETTVLKASDYKYKDYQEVQKMLEEKGFTNISTEILYDIVFGWTSEGEVDSVSIDGKTDYEEGEVFKKDSPIIITYHMKKADDPNNQSNNTTSEQNEDSKDDSMSVDEFVDFLKEFVKQYETDHSKYEVKKFMGTIFVNNITTGMHDLGNIALSGNADAKKSWDGLASSSVELSKTLKEVMNSNGIKNYDLTVDVLDDTNTELVLIEATNGKLTFDAVNGINNR